MQEKNINLIGKKLNNSLSLPIHAAIYDYLNLNLSYVNLEFETYESLKDNLISKLNSNEWFISNVTYPYKGKVLEFASEQNFKIDQSSKFAGGCNFINLGNKSVFNFDGRGAVYWIKSAGYNLKNLKVLILGTGITAKSIGYSILQEGASKVVFSSRDPLSNEIEGAQVMGYADLNEHIGQFDFIVNALPFAVDAGQLIDFNKISKSAVLMDISWIINKPKFVDCAVNAGLKVHDGNGMLISQAVYGIVEICKYLNVDNTVLNDFEKLYNIGQKAIDCRF